MPTPLHRQLVTTVAKWDLFAAGSRVGVAVSGGADSVALLLLLNDLREQLGIVLRVAHFNHQLRGPDADADESFVRELATQFKLECNVERADVRAQAARARRNLEDTARRLRLQFFDNLVAGGILDCVATAHTADDQAETVLMHILRGTGLTGLAGIHPRAGHVVRPLLETRREQLRGFLTSRHQSWREDATNLDTMRLRARIRHSLLPLLASDYQPAVVERLANLAGLAARDDAALDFLAGEIETSIDSGGDTLAIQARHLQQLPGPMAGAKVLHAALSSRIIRRLLGQVRGDSTRITTAHVDQVIALAHANEGARLDLPGVKVERRGERVLFTKASRPRASAPEAFEFPVALPATCGEVSVGHPSHRYRLKLFDCVEQGRDTTIGAEALDAERLCAPLVLRNWRPGDAYRPHNRKSSHKLKRLFSEKKIPLAERAAWPVLLCGTQIVWARQFGPAHQFAAGTESRRIVEIIEEPS